MRAAGKDRRREEEGADATVLTKSRKTSPLSSDLSKKHRFNSEADLGTNSSRNLIYQSGDC